MRNKRIIVLVAALVLAAAGISAAVLVLGRGGELPEPAYILEKSVLEYVAEADGSVESAVKTEVYAPSSLKVLELLVREGDTVREGDPLAQLDTEALELEIRRAELNILSAEANLSSEQLSLANSVTAARNSLDSASVSLKAAQREYDTLKSQQGNEAAVATARVNLDIARRGLENAKTLYELGDISLEELTQAENAFDKANASYEEAERSASDALNRALETLEAAKIRSKNASDAVDDAVSKNTDPAAVSLDLQKVALEEKKLRLRDARVTSPAAGRVTLVKAKEGAPASGLMFVIEDAGNLIVRARVEETDIADIALGMGCRIVPAGRDIEINGTVITMPSAAERDDTGAFTAATGDDVFFIVEAALNEVPEGVFVGMNAKISFIVDTRESCFAAPRGLVYSSDGASYVLIRSGDELVELPVETGLETGRMTEIISESLRDGMELYNR